MSSSARGGERMVHQDFIARIRFQNTLPPPPIPPKLLDVPNTGLSSGQYTNPAFASRLVREQPLNIEADAELGMPLDLVGMPGIFDGDESSIQAPAHPPPVHPHDRALLKPLSALGKPKAADAGVSFLRRTEYIAPSSKKAAIVDSRRSGIDAGPRRPKRKSPEPDAGTPAYVKRKIEKSFDAACKALTPAMRDRIKHPSKKTLKLVEALPLLPDLDAFPDSGAYVTIKFIHGPLPSSNAEAGTESSKYDTRLLSSIFRPIERSDSEQALYDAAMEAHQLDPERNPAPANNVNYDLFLADTARTADNFRTKFDLDNPDREDDDLYTADLGNDRDGRCFRYNRIRGYETAEEKEMTHRTKYDEEILISTGEGGVADEAGGRKTAAWYYPVMQRTVVRNQRTKSMARMHSQASDDNDKQIDALDVMIFDPTEDMSADLARIKADPLDFADADSQEEEEAAAQQLQEESGAAQEAERGGSSSPEANGRGQEEDAEEDADGDAEEDAEGDEEED